MTSFLIALQFLTRIPIKLKTIPSEQQTAQSLLYYPVVGLIIGIILYLINLSLTNTTDEIRAAMVLLGWVAITGALHLDGLADSADALVGGYGDKEKTLAIMKDPYCGPVGVVSLVVLLLLKFSFILSLSTNNTYLLILAPLLARTSVIASFLVIPYVRQQGLGSSMANHLPHKQSIAIIAATSSIVLFAFGWNSVAIFFSIVIVFYLLKKILLHRIGGITGDTLGAQIEIMETLVLIVGLATFAL